MFLSFCFLIDKIPFMILIFKQIKIKYIYRLLIKFNYNEVKYKKIENIIYQINRIPI